MKSNRILSTLLMLFAFLLVFNACKPDDPEPKEAKITAFAVTNAGAEANLRVDGAIDGTNILVVVPFETDVTKLIIEVQVSTGATVIPASGSELDFSDSRNFVVTNGDINSTYVVTVQKADPTQPVLTAIAVEAAGSGAQYGVSINIIARTITVTLNSLQSKVVKVSNLQLLPAGTTWVLAPLVTSPDIIDLAANPTLTLSFAGETSVYSFVTNVTQAGFNPENTTLMLDRSAKSGLVPTSINDELTRGAAFDGRYVYVASRKEGNFVYVWDVETPAADPAQLNFGDIVSGGTWVISDVRAVGGNIFVSNMVMSQDQVFKVYKWDGKDDETPELVLEYFVPGSDIRLGDAISIIGNPPENGYIIASNFAWPNNASEFYVWNFNSGKSPTFSILPIVPTEALRMGQYGRVTAIPGEPDKLLVTGAELVLGVIDFEGNFLYEVTEPMIQSRSFDYRIFEYNDGLYLSYVVNREWEASTAADKGIYYDVINISEGGNIIEALNNLNDNNIAQKRVFRHNFGVAASQWVGATHQVGFGSNGKPRAMSFALRNGFVVHEFSN